MVQLLKKPVMVLSLLVLAACSTKNTTAVQSVSFSDMSPLGKSVLMVNSGLTEDQLNEFRPGDFPQVSKLSFVKKAILLLDESVARDGVQGLEIREYSQSKFDYKRKDYRSKIVVDNDKILTKVSVGMTSNKEKGNRAKIKIKQASKNPYSNLDEEKIETVNVRIHQISGSTYAIVYAPDGNESSFNDFSTGVKVQLVDISSGKFFFEFESGYEEGENTYLSEEFVIPENLRNEELFRSKTYSLDFTREYLKNGYTYTSSIAGLSGMETTYEDLLNMDLEKILKEVEEVVK